MSVIGTNRRAPSTNYPANRMVRIDGSSVRNLTCVQGTGCMFNPEGFCTEKAGFQVSMNYLKKRRQSLPHVALILMLGLIASSAMAEDTELHQVVDGIAVYFGVLPAEMIRGHPRAHPESQMHGGIPTDHRYHLTVAIFDDASSERITSADVTVKITGSDRRAIRKALEPMAIAGKRSYGNYFRMPGAGPYRIEIQIRRPDLPGTTRAVFEWGRS